MYHSKHFTVNEARGLLPAIKDILTEIIELKRRLDTKGIDVYRHHYSGGIGSNGSAGYDEDMEKLISAVSKISEKGIIIKGIDTGLIDFPHLRSNGEEVYLCLQSGENDIEYWHRIPDGFSGRRPIAEL